MTAEPTPAFGVLLGRYRVAIGLTQEELAERAGLSVEAISALERGLRTRPRAITVRKLADALHLSQDDRGILEHAVQGASAAPRDAVALPEGNFLGALPSGELVGRSEECERIRWVLDAVMNGSGHLVLLSGEVGVGKTRLLQDVMIEAGQRGFVILISRRDVSGQGTPYSMLLEVLSTLTANAPAAIRSEVRREWKLIQQLVTARSRSDGREQSYQIEQQLFGAATDMLLMSARAMPLALLLDDLHWADSDSLRFVRHIAYATRSAPILLAGTFCDHRLGEEHPDLMQTLQTLSHERLLERLSVRRLSLEETSRLVAVTMGHEDVSEEFASFVYRRTKGVPRLIDGLVRSLGGRLELQEEVGAGSMGRVFRAFDRVIGMTIAAKLVLARTEIDLDALLRFQQEGAVLARLEHPRIVDVYDTFAEEHATCIIMELLDGKSLGQILRAGPLPLSRARYLALQVADALSYAHSQSIVHRDIKPDNVMVLADDQVKVTDFGIARLLQPDTSLHTMATTGMRMGTPLYMAPEQIEGKQIDGRTDIYALGAMLYHMVTGRPPFEGSDALAVAIKHLQEEPSPPSGVDPTIPEDWDAFILKCMARDPANRFQSATEVGQAVQMLTEQPENAVRTEYKRRGADSVVRAMASVVAVAVMAIGVLLIGRHFATAAARVPLQLSPAEAVAVTVSVPDMSGSFTHLALSRGALWDTNTTTGNVIRFDTNTNREVGVIHVGDPAGDPGQNDPFDVASGDGQVWATDRAKRAVVQIDPRTDHVTASVHIGILATGLAISGNTLWAVADPITTPISQNLLIVGVDLRTRRIVKLLHAQGYPLGLQIASMSGAVWVMDPGGVSELERLDIVSDRVIASIDTGPQAESLAAGDGAVWVMNQPGTSLVRIDSQTNRVLARIDLSRYPGRKPGCACHNVAVGAGAVWAIARNRTLVRIDPRTNRVTAAVIFKRIVNDVAAGGQSVWVGTDGPAPHYQIDRIDAQVMR